MACLAYAGVEVLEWVLLGTRRGSALLWDGILDWTGVATRVGMFWAAWENQLGIMAWFCLAGFVIAQVGVVKRSYSPK